MLVRALIKIKSHNISDNKWNNLNYVYRLKKKKNFFDSTYIKCHIIFDNKRLLLKKMIIKEN